MMEFLNLEIPKVFKPAFKKAIEQVNSVSGLNTVKITSEKFDKTENSFDLYVQCHDAMACYHLGRYYSIFKDEI